MGTISVEAIRRDPRDFIERVEAGEEMVVVQGTEPVAEVRPLPARLREPRPYGLCAGRFTVPADFDQSLPEAVLQDFEGA